MIRFERVERIGEGRENFSEEKFSLPSPNPTFQRLLTLSNPCSENGGYVGVFRLSWS